MIDNQGYLFVIFTVVGMIIGIIFDIFRISRKVIKTNDILTTIEDIVFLVFSGLIIIYTMYVFCNGQLRFFMIIGIALGIMIYLITISKYIIKFFTYIIERIIFLIEKLYNMVKKIIIGIFKVLRKTIFKHILFVCVNFRKNILNFLEKKRKK